MLAIRLTVIENFEVTVRNQLNVASIHSSFEDFDFLTETVTLGVTEASEDRNSQGEQVASPARTPI